MSAGLLFSTAASPHLVVPILEMSDLREAKYRLGSFTDGEIMFYLNEPVKGHPCFILGHTGPPAENLLRMVTIINTLKINGAKTVVAIIPFFGYGRSDKSKALEPINARLFAGFLKQAGASRVICLDLHSNLCKSYLTIPVTHLSAMPLLADYYLDMKLSYPAIVSPDRGGIDRAREFAKIFNEKHIVIITKSRPSHSSAEIRTISGEVSGRDAIIVDDMIQSGQTLYQSGKALKKLGVRRLFAAVTHCIYQAKGIELLTNASLFNEIVITNSLSNYHKPLPRVTILDISSLLSRAMLSSL